MKWLDAVRGDDSVRELARRIGSTHATLYRQASGGQLTFEVVRAISREYGRSTIGDLVATGLLSASEAGADDLEIALQTATDEQLVIEIARRLEVTDLGSLFDKPVSEAVAEAKVHQFPIRNVPAPVEDERAVAKKKSRDPGGDEGDF